MIKLFSSRSTPAHKGKLMGRRVTARYARKGTIHSNQAFFAVDRDSKGRFASRSK